MAEGFISSLRMCSGTILLQGKPAHTNDRTRAGDVLSVRVDNPAGHNPAAPISFPLSVIYEDDDLIILEKPAGMLVYGAPERDVTLANALAAYWGPDQPIHLVQRLDRGTSGLMAVAKSRYISERFRRSLHTDRFIRDYLALAEGQPEPLCGRIELPIGPSEESALRRCIRDDGQAAVTEYETVSLFPGGSILRLRLHTGRTHQIRVHLSAIGHPLFGDRLYGAAPSSLSRPALHSAHLTLLHPVSGEILDFHSALPSDLRHFLQDRGACVSLPESLFPPKPSRESHQQP